jgi:hypothetical protein
MLPGELLIYRQRGEELTPKRLPLSPWALSLAEELITLFHQFRGRRRGELVEALRETEGAGTDYRVRRGLAHLLENSFSTFEVQSPLDPLALRERVFRHASTTLPTEANTQATLERVALELGEELGREVTPDVVRRGLFADLHKNRVLAQFDPPAPDALLHRYNLAQVQGLFYRATRIVIHAYRNDPAEYKLLFRYLKLFQLLATIEGDVELGYTLTLDGPASLFRQTTRYGTKLAMMIPALLHVTRWQLVAHLHSKPREGTNARATRFTLDSESGLVSHYPKATPYDSLLEESLVTRWESTRTEWRLEREVELVPVPGSVMIPDFRLVHPDGRSYLLEIVGYWRPEYLRKKAWQVQQAQRDDLILAVSDSLNLEAAGVQFHDLPVKVIRFKQALTPKQVLDVIDS